MQLGAMRRKRRIHWSLTLLLSMFLAVGTWNPSEYNLISMMIGSDNLFEGFKPFAILLILALWILAIKAVYQSLKLSGVIIISILIGTFILGLQQFGLIEVNQLNQIGWILSISTGLIIWIGFNALFIWRKLTGVYSTDEVLNNSVD